MPSPAVPTATAGNLLHRFRRNRRGSAAIEFALVAPVFFRAAVCDHRNGYGILRQPGA
jgi:hypothetical protein